MPDLQPFAPTIGVVVGATIGFLAQWINGSRQFGIEKLRIDHSLRMARYDRLLATYETVLRVALVIREASQRLAYLSDAETPESRDQELVELFARVTTDLELARVRLLIHPESAAVRLSFETLNQYFIDLRNMERDKREGDRTIRGTAFGLKRRLIHETLDSLVATIQTSLEDVERPIDAVSRP